jgi:hypothetical protein
MPQERGKRQEKKGCETAMATPLYFNYATITTSGHAGRHWTTALHEGGIATLSAMGRDVFLSPLSWWQLSRICGASTMWGNLSVHGWWLRRRREEVRW